MEKYNVTKRAVLVGCNYPNTQFKLHGCINDVDAIRKVIEGKFGFHPKNVEVLTDAPGSNSVTPTGANIKAALNAMVKKAKPGDVLFFYFSGHGTGIPSLEPGQPFKLDEAIVPCDLNLITDVDFRNLVNRLPERATFTILSDSSHSGRLIDKEKEQIGPSAVTMASDIQNAKAKGIFFDVIHNILNKVSNAAQIATNVIDTVSSAAHQATNIIKTASNVAGHFQGFFGKDVSLKFYPQHIGVLLDLDKLKEDEGIMLSGCQANETSFERVLSESGGENAVHGAFTKAVVTVLDQHSGDVISNKQLVMEARKALKNEKIKQIPCLYCSDKNANAPFLGGPSDA